MSEDKADYESNFGQGNPAVIVVTHIEYLASRAVVAYKFPYDHHPIPDMVKFSIDTK